MKPEKLPSKERQLLCSINALKKQATISGYNDPRIDRYRTQLAKLRVPSPITLSEFKSRLANAIGDIADSFPSR